MDPTISALSAYAGVYQKSLYARLVNKLDASTDLFLMSNVKKRIKLTKLAIGAGARPHSITTEARDGDIRYTGKDIDTFMGKRDLEIAPIQYWDTWMNQVQAPGVQNMDIPFAQFVWQQVMDELAAEINDKTAFFGFDVNDAVDYDAGTGYAVGDYVAFSNGTFIDYYKCIVTALAGDTPLTDTDKWQQVNAEAICPGLKYYLDAAIDDESLVPVGTGAITNTTAYAQFTEMFRSFTPRLRNKGITIFASYDSTDCLADDFENKITKYTETDPATGITYLSKTEKKCIIKPATWMGSSGMLLAAPYGELIMATDKLSDLNKVHTFEKLRTLEAGIDFAIGFQVRDAENVRVSDQD